MQPYPSELKEAVLEHALSGEIPLNAAPQTDKLAFAEVRKWRDNALAGTCRHLDPRITVLGKGHCELKKLTVVAL